MMKTRFKEMTHRLFYAIEQGYCPACDSRNSLISGPGAAACLNLKCGACGNKYNLGPWSAQWIGWEEPQPLIQAEPPAGG